MNVVKTEKYFALELNVRAIKGRDRTIKTHRERLLEVPDLGQPLDQAQLPLNLVLERLKGYKMLSQIEVMAIPIACDTYEDGRQIESMSFGPRTQRFQVGRP